VTITQLAIPAVVTFTPRVFQDARGHFFEAFRQQQFEETAGPIRFVQDNQSHSKRGVLRGLHYQVNQPQGKLLRVLHGEIFDVAVDLRRSSPTFGRWVGEVLSSENRRQLWIPVGFAHGFLVLSESADVLYKTTAYYSPQDERAIRWNDPALGVQWPMADEPLLSPKDAAAALLADAALFE